MRIRSTILSIFIVAGVMRAAAGEPLAVPFFKQEKNGCGAASVAMVMHYWAGHSAQPAVAYPTPEQAYQRLYTPERNGIMLSDMKRFLDQSGFQAFTLRAGWQDVEEHLGKGRPLIVTQKKSPKSPIHYAVVTGVGPEYVSLNDPTHKGVTRLKRAEFEKRWDRADRWMLLAAPKP